MGTTPPARVRVARCRDNAEAAIVRSLLAAHDIDVVISGEQHAAMLGGMAGPFLTLDVWVDREDAERAAELLVSLREGLPEDADEPGDVGEAEDGEEEQGPTRHWGIELRKRTAVVLILSCIITFGTGHLYARAWVRGLLLAGIELLGFTRVRAGHADSGAALVVLAVAVDLVGAMILVRRAVREQQLPAARAR